MHRVLRLVFIPIAIISATSTAQQAPSAPSAATFEVASIRPTQKTLSDPMELRLLKNVGRNAHGSTFRLPNANIHLLIELAYDIFDEQIVGEPPWAMSKGYAITAKADGNRNFEQMRPMLQALLSDRFKLAFHKETRELPTFELALAKGGLNVTPSQTGSCVIIDPNGPRPPIGSKVCGGLRQGISEDGSAFIEGFDVPMTAFAQFLSDQLGRPVVDKTGLTGLYSFHLDFTPDDSASPIGDPGVVPTQHPLLATALQEQLGARLKSAKNPVQVLVIDHLEPPTEN